MATLKIVNLVKRILVSWCELAATVGGMAANSHHYSRGLRHAPIMAPDDGVSTDAQQNRHYDVARDGRFLINTESDSATAPITLLTNWNPEAKK